MKDVSDMKSIEEHLLSLRWSVLGAVITVLFLVTVFPNSFPKQGFIVDEQIHEIDQKTCTQLANYLIMNDYDKNDKYDLVYKHAQIIYEKEKCFQ